MTKNDREKLTTALETINSVLENERNNDLTPFEIGDLRETRSWLEPIANDSYPEWEVNPEVEPPTEGSE